MKKDNFLKVKDICEMLQIDRRYIFKIITEGELPAYKIGKAWRIQTSDFEAWLKSRKAPEKTSILHDKV